MKKPKSLEKALILLAVFLGCFSTAKGCSLALHDWKLVFYLKVPVAAPLFPLAEVSAITSKVPEKATRQISWVTSSNVFVQFARFLLPLLPDWPAKLPWKLIEPEFSVLSLAKDDSNDFTPLVIGSDKCFLKIAFFSDANSNFNCHQLVLLQSNRIRAVFADKKSPWAQEIQGQSWLSLIFYQLPVPGRILSFSAFPIGSMRQSLSEDHSFVEKLLAERKLLRRPDLVIDPYSFDFPELPR